MRGLEEEIRRLRSMVERLAEEVEKLKAQRFPPEAREPQRLGELRKRFDSLARMLISQLGETPGRGVVFVGAVEWEGDKVRESSLTVIGLEDVETCPPRRVADAASPLANEHRVRILQELLKGPKTASELSEATGLEGGQLYHHLKELAFAGYLETVERGKYALTGRGAMALRALAAVASTPGG